MGRLRVNQHQQYGGMKSFPSCMSESDLCLFRTLVCEEKKNNIQCSNDSSCPFSHCMSWQRRNPFEVPYQSTLCPRLEFKRTVGEGFNVINRCSIKRTCSFSHTKEEQLYHPFVYKTQLCKKFPDCGKKYCPFAHGSEQVRYPRDTFNEHKMSKDNAPLMPKLSPPMSLCPTPFEADIKSLHDNASTHDHTRASDISFSDLPQSGEKNEAFQFAPDVMFFPPMQQMTIPIPQMPMAMPMQYGDHSLDQRSYGLQRRQTMELPTVNPFLRKQSLSPFSQLSQQNFARVHSGEPDEQQSIPEGLHRKPTLGFEDEIHVSLNGEEILYRKVTDHMGRAVARIALDVPMHQLGAFASAMEHLSNTNGYGKANAEMPGYSQTGNCN